MRRGQNWDARDLPVDADSIQSLVCAHCGEEVPADQADEQPSRARERPRGGGA